MKLSAEADWGGIRYGKGFRAKPNVKMLARWLPEYHDIAVLDIGSSRGAFAEAFLEIRPYASIRKVEPDRTLDLTASNIYRAKIEDCDFMPASFDLIYSCHTLEHLDDPAAVLRQHSVWIKPGGLLFVEVPNIAFCLRPDIIEDFFIDRHVSNFSVGSLNKLLTESHFHIVHQEVTDHNISTICVRSEPKWLYHLHMKYRETRAANIKKISAVARRIEELDPVLWGAGRIFDALCRYGELDLRKIAGLVDTQLIKYTKEVRGEPLFHPYTTKRPIVILSRAFAEEIRAEAIKLSPKVFTFSELLEAE